MLCGMAQNLEQMVLFRALQGVTGAFIAPLSQAFMLDTNKPSKHAQMMALWGMGIMIGPILGPVLGGWLTEQANWRWVFYVNLPVGILSLAILVTQLPRRETVKRRFDLAGFVMLGVALAGLPAAAMAYLGEEVAPNAQGRAMGLYIAGNAFGGMTGRFLTAWVTDIANWQIALLVLGILGAVAALAFWFGLPASRHFRRRSISPDQVLADTRALLRDAGPDQVADALGVGHDSRDQDTGLCGIEVADRQPRDVPLDTLPHFGDGALGRDTQHL